MTISRAIFLAALFFSFSVRCLAVTDNVALGLLQARQFDQLDARLGEAQRRFESGQLTEYGLRDYFRPFNDAGSVEDLTVFVAQCPQSYAAHLLLGIRYKRQGAIARGGKYIADTPQSQIDEMNRLLGLAESELRASLKLTAKPYWSLFHLLEITGLRGDHSGSLQFMSQANRALPENELARDRYALFMTPRWGGSYAEMDDFIAKSISDGAPEKVILQLRAIEHQDKGRVLAEHHEKTAAGVEFSQALELGESAGGTFRKEFLVDATRSVCTSTNASAYCR